MIWGIVGITIMMGVFMIMNMILKTLGISDITINSSTGENSVDLKK